MPSLRMPNDVGHAFLNAAVNREVDPMAAPGFGLRGMQERAQALGGNCKVDSARGCGTSIRIMIPLRERRS